MELTYRFQSSEPAQGTGGKVIFVVAIVGGIFTFVLIYGLLHMRRYLPHYQVQRRLESINEAPIENKPARRSFNFAEVGDSKKLSEIPFRQRIIEPLKENLQKLFMKLAPSGIYQTIEDKIVLAGKQDLWSVSSIIFAWGLMICGLIFVWIMIAATSELAIIQKVMLLAMSLIVGAVLPMYVLNYTVKKRQNQMLMQLPGFLDLLCVSVQAGLSFDAALSKIMEKMKGPLIDEFERMQRETRIGIPRRDALQNMARRCDMEEVYLFTTSVIQAERLGTGMGKTLLDQANNMRDRYQQYIKSMALKAPIKILFPLVLFIFPTIFIIILVPPLINVLNHLTIIPKS